MLVYTRCAYAHSESRRGVSRKSGLASKTFWAVVFMEFRIVSFVYLLLLLFFSSLAFLVGFVDVLLLWLLVCLAFLPVTFFVTDISLDVYFLGAVSLCLPILV